MPAQMSLRERRRRKACDEIVEIALDLFRRRGYGDTSVEQIATQALISPRTFYRYFPAKEDLVFFGFPAVAPTVQRHLAELAEHSLFEALEEGALRWVEILEADREAVLERLPLILEVPELIGRHVRLGGEQERVFTQVISRHLAPGANRRRVAEVVSAAVTGALTAALRRWVQGGGRPALQTLVREALELLRPAIEALDSQTRR